MKIQRAHIQEQQMGTFHNGVIRCCRWTDLMAHCCQGEESYSLCSSSCSLCYDFGYMFLPWSSSSCIMSQFLWLTCQKFIWFDFGFLLSYWGELIQAGQTAARCSTRKSVHHSAGSEARGMQIEGRMTGKEEKRMRGTLDISETVGRSNIAVT